MVKNTHFNVNTRITKSHQMDKFKSIRQGDVQKRGLEISDKAQRRLGGRSIAAGKFVSDPPVSMISLHEEYRPNQMAHNPLK
jgi:hypothetical protein